MSAGHPGGGDFISSIPQLEVSTSHPGGGDSAKVAGKESESEMGIGAPLSSTPLGQKNSGFKFHTAAATGTTPTLENFQ